MSREFFDLGDASRAIGEPWEQILALVKRGVIAGHQHRGGTWALEAESVLAYARERAHQRAQKEGADGHRK